MSNRILLLGCLFLSQLLCGQSTFIRVENSKFIKNNQPYHYIGTNYWYGAQMGALNGDRQRLIAELDELKKLGITNLRILVGAEGGDQDYTVTPALQPQKGQYNAELLEGLDFVLAEMSKRDLNAVLYLTNNWEWSGGMAKYLEWNGYGTVPNPNLPGHTWPEFMEFTKQFHSCKPCQSDLLNHVTLILNRTNSITQKKYTDDPTIMAWEVANEPRIFGSDNEGNFTLWLNAIVHEIKRLAPHQLVTTGSEGMAGSNDDLATFERTHNNPEIDYLTMHIWPKNWGWYKIEDEAATTPIAIAKTLEYITAHTTVANRLRKPLVLEEFGFPRSQESRSSSGDSRFRNTFYQAVFERLLDAIKKNEPFTALNFWGYGGKAQIHPTRGKWEKGDDYTTDPPQEPQGLNSVFSTDTSTLKLIKKYIRKINN